MGIFNLIVLGVGIYFAFMLGSMKGKRDATPVQPPEPPSPIDKPTTT